MKKFMNKPKATGSMIQWVIELNQFDIEYHPRTTIKEQALADFIAKFTIPDEDGEPTKQKDRQSRLTVSQLERRAE